MILFVFLKKKLWKKIPMINLFFKKHTHNTDLKQISINDNNENLHDINMLIHMYLKLNPPKRIQHNIPCIYVNYT